MNIEIDNHLYKIFDCEHVFDKVSEYDDRAKCSKCQVSILDFSIIKRYYTVEFREFKFSKLEDKL